MTHTPSCARHESPTQSIFEVIELPVSGKGFLEPTLWLREDEKYLETHIEDRH